MTQGGFDPQRDGEPYPLLLVRPAGISAYYAALSAMESWRSEFGYEMIGDDWPLVFPKPDPQLARTLDQAVAGADPPAGDRGRRPQPLSQRIAQAELSRGGQRHRGPRQQPVGRGRVGLSQPALLPATSQLL